MYIECTLDSDWEQMRLREQDRKAVQSWRFRHLKSRERRVLVAILTSLLSSFFG